MPETASHGTLNHSLLTTTNFSVIPVTIETLPADYQRGETKKKLIKGLITIGCATLL
jgi:hypothetical protein